MSLHQTFISDPSYLPTPQNPLAGSPDLMAPSSVSNSEDGEASDFVAETPPTKHRGSRNKSNSSVRHLLASFSEKMRRQELLADPVEEREDDLGNTVPRWESEFR